MTVNLGPDRFLGASTLLGASQFLGQGNSNTARDIEWELLFSTDDASVSIPSWTYIQSDLRGISVQRGRGSELQDVDAGTCTLTLDNRARKYDPLNASSPFSPNLRPMNRVWLRMRFNGVTHDVFKGWVERYEQQYPSVKKDAITIVHAVDEFKVLALRNQPTSDPPRDTYADVINFDMPAGYWRMNTSASAVSEQAETGPEIAVDLSVSNGMSSLVSDGGVTGENPDPTARSLQLAATQYLFTEAVTQFQTVDAAGLSALTIETWLKVSGFPGTAHTIVRGPQGVYGLQLDTGGTVTMFATNGTPTTFNATSGAIGANVWYHVVGVVTGSNTLIYINGVQSGSASFSGTISATTVPAYPYFRVGSPSSAVTMQYDELAMYRYALSATRIAAHYTAGASRGYERSQLPGERIGRVLDSISSMTPRNLKAGTRPLAGQWTGNGQNTLDVMREVENAEAVDAFNFIASDGTITFLDGAHRSSSPYDTVQATFGDAGGSELDYMDIQLDYSDSFIANQWEVTRDGGTIQTTSDTTSKSRYGSRPQSLTGLKLRDDADAADVAADMLAKYKDPLTRVLTITPKTMNTAVLDAVFPLDLGDRIRVLLTPPGGGARFDQTLFVQSISIDAIPQQVFPQIVLGVSPV